MSKPILKVENTAFAMHLYQRKKKFQIKIYSKDGSHIRTSDFPDEPTAVNYILRYFDLKRLRKKS